MPHLVLNELSRALWCGYWPQETYSLCFLDVRWYCNVFVAEKGMRLARWMPPSMRRLAYDRILTSERIHFRLSLLLVSWLTQFGCFSQHGPLAIHIGRHLLLQHHLWTVIPIQGLSSPHSSFQGHCSPRSLSVEKREKFIWQSICSFLHHQIISVIFQALQRFSNYCYECVRNRFILSLIRQCLSSKLGFPISFRKYFILHHKYGLSFVHLWTLYLSGFFFVDLLDKVCLTLQWNNSLFCRYSMRKTASYGCL